MRKTNTTTHEEGFVLVTTLLVVLVLTIIGIAANRNTSTELQIAGNNKVHKKTFYGADAGTTLGAEVLEQNMNCPIGFSAASIPLEDKIDVPNPVFTYQYSPEVSQIRSILDNDNLADVSYYVDDINSGMPRTYLYMWGSRHMAAGGSLIMVAGYERKGKAAADGGVYILFDIFSKRYGMANSESIILLGWLHMIGMESTCYY